MASQNGVPLPSAVRSVIEALKQSNVIQATEQFFPPALDTRTHALYFCTVSLISWAGVAAEGGINWAFSRKSLGYHVNEERRFSSLRRCLLFYSNASESIEETAGKSLTWVFMPMIGRSRLLHSVVPSILLVSFQIITIGCQYQMAMIFWCQWSVSEFGTKYLCGVEFHCRAYLLNILTIQLWKWDVSKQIL